MCAEPQMEPDRANPDSGPETAEAERSVVSCNSCRKRKARCTREFPTCQPCQKIGVECEYKVAKAKPGMKPGTIEGIQRRLGRLEEAFAQQGVASSSGDASTDGPAEGPGPGDREIGRPQTAVAAVSTSTSNDLQNLVALFVTELRKAGRELPAPRQVQTPTSSAQNGAARSDQPEQGTSNQRTPRSPKRRRLDVSFDNDDGAAAGFTSPVYRDAPPALPTGLAFGAMIRTYFTHIHPWIPMIQERRFRNRLADASERPKLDLILLAMLVSTASCCEELRRFEPQQLEQARSWIISRGISAFSVEALQALTIIAFTDIGNGEGSRAWSIVGALTRTAEYLQLTTEQDHHHRRPLLSPAESLVPPSRCSWVEVEERRRVFWNIFNLDRFCSVSMGWNTSLTSDDVHRRLPCDVELWHREESRHDDEIITPYFNIWDRSATRIGNTITFIPSHTSFHESPQSQGFSAVVDDEEGQSPPDGGGGGGPSHSSNRLAEANRWSSTTTSMVGAFAYNVEATESLSRVTTHFLQQKVDLRNQREMSSWLTRFKELDLRLIHWKMLLPQKWKPNMAAQSVKMDPNLTVAHITHNASILLLHQPIAFLSSALFAHPAFGAQLPSASSASTCRAAAVEIALITKNYLKTSSGTLPLSNQFAFCVYVAARSLLVHWRYYSTPEVAPEYHYLLDSLGSMADRWCGGIRGRDLGPADCLAGRYARKLDEMHRRCVESDLFRIDPLEYTNDISHQPRTLPPSRVDVEKDPAPGRLGLTDVQGSHGMVADPRDGLAAGRQGPQYGDHGLAGRTGVLGAQEGQELLRVNLPEVVAPELQGPGDLNSVLNDHQFLDMDRVISLQDGMFDVDYEGQGWE